MFRKIALLFVFAVASTLSFGQNELVLTAVSSNPQPAPWSFTSVTFTLQNQSFSTYSNVTVDFNLNNNLRLKGGDEFTSSAGTLQGFWTNFPTWNIGNIGPSQEESITLNIFVLGNSAPSHVYGQVETAIGDPLFSTPGNGTCCTPNERDEAVFNLNGGLPGGNPDIVVNYWGLNPAPTQGGTAYVDWRFKNIGSADSPNFKYGIYLSQDQTFSADDILVNNQLYNYRGMTQGQTTDVSQSFQLPAGISGQYYVIVLVDPLQEMQEANENNQDFFRAMYINPDQSGFKAELKVERFTTTPTPTQGGTASLDFRIINNGAVASGDFKYNVHISTDPIFNQFPQPDPQVISLQGVTSIPAGGIKDETISFQLPAAFSGQYFALVLLDVLNEVDEEIENNNQGTYSLFINPSGGGVDLAPFLDDITDAQITPDVPGWRATVDYRIINNGPSQSPSSSHGLYVSRDGNISPDDVFVGTYFTSTLDPGASQSFSREFSFPENLTGDFYLVIDVDIDDTVSEINEQNNVQGIAFKTGSIGNNGIDLEPLFVFVSDAALTQDVSGWAVTADFLIRNNGSQTSPASSYGLYVSRDRNITVGDVYLGPISISSIDAGETKGFNRTITFPESLTGDFYLILAADVGNAIPESNELNNVVSRAFKTVPSGGVDLELEILIPQDLYNWPQWSFFEVPVRITNRGTQAATGVVAEFDPSDATTFKGGDEATVSQGNFNWIGETWNVGTIQPGNSAVATINLFRLSPSTFTLQSQITNMNETDIDSTPGSGLCCFEDDESEWTVAGSNINGINNRSMIVENLGNQPFAIVNAMPNPVVDQFNLQVYSNENQTSELTIVNTLGQPVFHQEVELVEGHNTIPVQLENTAAGLHTVRMTPFHPYLRQFKVMKIND